MNFDGLDSEEEVERVPTPTPTTPVKEPTPAKEPTPKRPTPKKRASPAPQPKAKRTRNDGSMLVHKIASVSASLRPCVTKVTDAFVARVRRAILAYLADKLKQPRESVLDVLNDKEYLGDETLDESVHLVDVFYHDHLELPFRLAASDNETSMGLAMRVACKAKEIVQEKPVNSSKDPGACDPKMQMLPYAVLEDNHQRTMLHFLMGDGESGDVLVGEVYKNHPAAVPLIRLAFMSQNYSAVMRTNAMLLLRAYVQKETQRVLTPGTSTRYATDEDIRTTVSDVVQTIDAWDFAATFALEVVSASTHACPLIGVSERVPQSHDVAFRSPIEAF